MTESTIPQLFGTVTALAVLFSSFWLLRSLLLQRPDFINILLFWRERPTAHAADEGGSSSDVSHVGLKQTEEEEEEEKEEEAPVAVEQGADLSVLLKQGPLIRAQVEWVNITFRVVVTHGKKTILHGVSGAALPQEMLAILGPSGCGKSTLLDILSMHKSTGSLSGSILVNGQRRTRKFLSMSTYVPQHDNFVPTMKSEEVLHFCANLVLPLDSTRMERTARVREVLEMMGLGHQAHTLVGGTLPGGLLLRGLSGGERKRLNIGAGIVGRPSVVFLDEPTTGLDSFAALTVMQYMKFMSRAGHTTIASIHQPRSAIWSMFDQVLLLSQGRLMYHGTPQGMVDWFSGTLGYHYDPEVQGSPSDWVLDLVGVGFDKSKEKVQGVVTMGSVEQLIEASKSFREVYVSGSPGGQANGGTPAVDAGEASTEMAESPQNSDVLGPAEETGPNVWMRVRRFMRQFNNLLWRQFLILTRNPSDVAGRMLVFTVVGILTGLITWNYPNTAETIQRRMGLLYLVLTFMLLTPFVFMSFFTADKQFFEADIKSKLYTTTPYYLAKTLAALPFNILNVVSYSLITYGMAGLRHSAASAAEFTSICVLASLIAMQMQYWFVLITPTQDFAFMVAIAWTAINLLVCNVYILLSEMTLQWLSQLRYISVVYFSWGQLLKTELGDRVFRCGNLGNALEAVGLVSEILPSTGMFGTFKTMLARPDPTCYVDPNALIDYYDVEGTYSTNIGILLGYLVVSHVLAYITLVIKSRRLRSV